MSSERKRSWIHTLLMLLWMVFIFSRSMRNADDSTLESLRVLEFLKSILPFELTDHIVRKCAHFIEFAVLGTLAVWQGYTRSRDLSRSIPWGLLIGVLTALSDETLQLSVPGRSGQLSDVWLDSAGVLTGALAFLVLQKLVSRVRYRPQHARSGTQRSRESNTRKHVAKRRNK